MAFASGGGGGGAQIPDGMYEAFLARPAKDVENRFYKPEEDPEWRQRQWEWTFAIRGGDFDGKTIRRWTSVATGPTSKTAETLAALMHMSAEDASSKMRSGALDETSAVGKPIQLVVQSNKVKMVMQSSKDAASAEELVKVAAGEGAKVETLDEDIPF